MATTDQQQATRVPEANQPGHHPPVEQDKPGSLPKRVGRLATTRRFRFAFEPLLAAPALPFGITPWTAWVDLTSEALRVRFGAWSTHVTRGNIDRAEVTGPYRFIKVAGPPHLSLADRGVTFATNRTAGVCIRLHNPIRAIDPLGIVRHPALTVTVDDVDELAALLNTD
jgi:hypothetical protein